MVEVLSKIVIWRVVCEWCNISILCMYDICSKAKLYLKIVIWTRCLTGKKCDIWIKKKYVKGTHTKETTFQTTVSIYYTLFHKITFFLPLMKNSIWNITCVIKVGLFAIIMKKKHLRVSYRRFYFVSYTKKKCRIWSWVRWNIYGLEKWSKIINQKLTIAAPMDVITLIWLGIRRL